MIPAFTTAICTRKNGAGIVGLSSILRRIRLITDSFQFLFTEFNSYSPGRIGVLRIPLLFICLWCVTQSRADDQVKSRLDQTESLESFFTHFPSEAEAEFKVFTPAISNSGPSPGVLIGAASNFVSLRLSGDNYLMFRTLNSQQPLNQQYLGRYNGLLWVLNLNQGFIEFDPKLNLPGTQNNPANMNVLGELAIRRLVNFGVQNMVPGSAVWDAAHKCFLATYIPFSSRMNPWGSTAGGIGSSQSRRASIEFTYENGIATAATVREDGGNTYLIDYKYDSNFHHARLPEEFVCYYKARTDANRIFQIQIDNLTIPPSGSIGPSELDPHLKLKDKYAFHIIWSNSISYSIGLKGEMQKVLSAEEAHAAKVKRMENRYQHANITTRGLTRGTIIGVMLLPLVVLAIIHTRNKRRKKGNNVQTL